MSRSYDVIVIGAGIYGACVLRDAALRGLSALLLERHHWGGETSHNSNKIIHSGIRYLQHLDLPRVLECVQETRNWMHIAPHLVEPMPFAVPSYRLGMRGKGVMGSGVRLHDLIKRSMGCNLDAGGTLSAAQTLEWFPMLDPRGLRGAAYWHDGQLQNANQLVDECIEDAIAAGAEAMSYTEVKALRSTSGRVTGVVACGQGEDEPFEACGRVVVNATGPWLQTLLPESLRGRHGFGRHYAGMNLVIDQVTARAGLAMHGPEEGGEGSRLYFLTPWKQRSIIGTSHVPFHGHPEEANYSAEAVAELIRAANQAFPFLQLDPEGVHYVYQGLTPAAGDQETVTRSRQFSIIDHGPRDMLEGLISVMGVKLTSARFIAERVVNLVESKLGRSPTVCTTAHRLLPGATRRQPQRESADDCGPRQKLLALAARPCASRLSDLVTCRTELAELGLIGLGDLEACADVMARAQGWSAARREWELDAARSRLRL